ncbi:rhotekin-like [Tyto alba]|uniref:rhotekin-like n=1 Tax=Tyto alba TaxID=56313 RepID=UPI001C672285|nr:rhotekin-like [Tyto alba]
MFCRSERSRVTVARGSALEMETRRGRCRLGLLADPAQDTEIQRKMERELRLREGACKLLAACSRREQALGAAKGLLLCNARVLAYMAELQRRKEAQVLRGRRGGDSWHVPAKQPESRSLEKSGAAGGSAPVGWGHSPTTAPAESRDSPFWVSFVEQTSVEIWKLSRPHG